jgi:hypothetical protein
VITLNEPTENKQNKNTSKQERIKLDQILKLLYAVSNPTLLNSINGLFNTSYNPNSTEVRIIKTNTEFIKPYNFDVIRADLFIRVIDKNNADRYNDYHIEFQLTADDTIIARLFQYDIYHAMSYISVDDSTGELVLRLSQSIVIYFEPSGKIPSKQRMRVDFPNGTSNHYEADIMKYYDFDDKQLIDKKIYNLIVLQLFCLRPELNKIKPDDKQAKADAKTKAEQIIAETIDTITELHQDKIINSVDYDLMITALAKIAEHLDKKYKYLKLGGNIEMIKTIADKNLIKRVIKAEEALEKAENDKIETVKKMILKNMEISEIIELTGYNEEQIKDIQKTK